MSGPRLKSLDFRREREASWRELERLVERCERRGLSSLAAADLARLPGLYRAATSSLSVARTISLDRNVVDYLDALCVRAYGCVYAARRGFFAALGDLLLRRFPSILRARSGAALLALAALVLGAVVGGATTSADSERFYAYVPSGLADDRGPHASTEALRRALYHHEGEAPRLAAFAAFLFTHNAMVGIVCFVLGIVAGFPTLLLLFGNGLVLGAFAALYHGRGLGLEMWAWLLPHGVPELTAIVVCGAAGLTLAQGFLFPGELSRVDSLAARGREAGVLVVGAVALLVVAGLLEGVVRQTVLDPAVRLAIAAALAVALAVWLRSGGGGEEGTP